MKNVFIIDEYVSSKVNGIGPFIKAYIQCLKKMDVSIHILLFNHNSLEFNIEKQNNISRYVFPSFSRGNFTQNYLIVNRFLRLYIKDSPENVFCFNHAPCLELLKTIKMSFPCSKLIFTIHDMGWCKLLNGDVTLLKDIVLNPQIYRKKYSLILKYFTIEKQMYQIVDAVICLSGSTEEIVKTLYQTSEDKVHLIPSGIGKLRQLSKNDITTLKSKYFLKDEERILIYAGRLSSAKGIYTLLEAFSELLLTHSNLRLIICGSANNKWSLFFRYAQKVASKIILTGFVSKQELSKLYQIADIGIIPSYYEQCPYVGMEMMMYKLPVVASDCNGLKEMFQDGYNAKIAKIGNRSNPQEFKNNLKKAIIDLLDNEELRYQLGQNAQEIYTSKYSISSMRKRYRNFYAKL